jgi:hypothetical protein
LNLAAYTREQSKKEDIMTRTKLHDLEEAPLTELSDEQLLQVCGGANDGTRATNLVTGGGDDDGGGGGNGRKIE